jgi:hypothetical protein
MQEVVLDTNVLVVELRSKRGISYQLVRSIGKAIISLKVRNLVPFVLPPAAGSAGARACGTRTTSVF